MAKKTSTRSGKKPASRNRESGITNALVEAAVELGHATEHLRTTLEHVQKARQKGGKAIEPMEQAGKKAIRAVRRHLPGR